MLDYLIWDLFNTGIYNSTCLSKRALFDPVSFYTFVGKSQPKRSEPLSLGRAGFKIGPWPSFGNLYLGEFPPFPELIRVMPALYKQYGLCFPFWDVEFGSLLSRGCLHVYPSRDPGLWVSSEVLATHHTSGCTLSLEELNLSCLTPMGEDLWQLAAGLPW